MLDPRTVLNQLMEQGRSQVEREIERDQIIHVDLSEYQIGSPRYEQLHAAMQLNQRFQWPSNFECNV